MEREQQSCAESYEYCMRVARSRAKNFYYSFLLLSKQQRKAMCAIYAFMRYCDDLSDEPEASPAAGLEATPGASVPPSTAGARRWKTPSKAASASTPCGRRFITLFAASAYRTSTSTL
jgi:phytoene/squalene synthetase